MISELAPVYLMCLTTDYFNELFECRLRTIQTVSSCWSHTSDFVRCAEKRSARAGTLPSRLKGQLKQSKLHLGCFKTNKRHSL